MNHLELPGDPYYAMTVRTFDPRSEEWSIWWFDGRHPASLEPPVKGRFIDGLGTFFANDNFQGVPIVVRFEWDARVIAGLFGLVSDLQSYISASGPFGPTFYQNPSVIGVVEAHSLAVLTAGTLWFLSTHHTGRFGHWVAVVAHVVMGGSNIIWFEVFTRVQAETQGIAVTVVHFAFVAVNAYFIVSPVRVSED